MTIQVYYVEGCPHYDPTVACVREVAAELGIEVAVKAIAVRDFDDARRLGFLGSPTVHVEGVDIDPAAHSLGGFALACRRYGNAGVPPRAMVREALLR